jgi:hypothetical protein
MSTPDPNPPIDATKPIANVGTVAADPSLGLLSHAIAVAVGALAGFLSLKLSVTLSPDTQAEITTAAVAAAVSLMHFVQAKISAKSKGA